MSGSALGYGILAAIFAAIFAMLFFSALWQQYSTPELSNYRLTGEVFVKYAVAFFFLGLAKWMGWKCWKGMKPEKSERVAPARRRLVR